MYLEINFTFIYPILTLILISLSSLNTRGFPLTWKLGVLTVAFGDLPVTLMELEMSQSSNEKDEIYFSFCKQSQISKKITIPD